MPTPFQVPSVLLHNDDRNLVIRIKAKIEAEENKTYSIAEIVRIALRELAAIKNA